MIRRRLSASDQAILRKRAGRPTVGRRASVVPDQPPRCATVPKTWSSTGPTLRRMCHAVARSGSSSVDVEMRRSFDTPSIASAKSAAAVLRARKRRRVAVRQAALGRNDLSAVTHSCSSSIRARCGSGLRRSIVDGEAPSFGGLCQGTKVRAELKRSVRSQCLREGACSRRLSILASVSAEMVPSLSIFIAVGIS